MCRRACATTLGTVVAIALALPGRASADDMLGQLAEAALAAPPPVELPVSSSPSTTIDEAGQVAAAALAAAEGPQQSSPGVGAGADTAISQAVSTAGTTAFAPDPPPAATAPDPAPTAPAAPAATPAPAGEAEAVSTPTEIAGAPPAADPPAVATQYQGENTSGIDSGGTSGPESVDGSASPSPEAGLTWIWNWTWNCGGSSAQSSSVTPSNLPGDTWIWDWQWSCDPAATPAPACSACNTAISVRILSPGDDGPVTQTVSSIAQTMASTVDRTVQSAVQNVVHESAPPPVIPVVTAPPLPPAFDLPVVAVPSATPVLQLQLESEAIVWPAIEGGIALVPPSPAGDGLTHRPPRGTGSPDASAVRQSSLPAPTTFAAALAPPTRRAFEALGARRSAAPAPPSARPSGGDKPRRAPVRLPAPFAPASQMSVASAASGTGSAGGTGLAILVGALLLAFPPMARWLRAVPASRPRVPPARRRDRPG